MFDPQRLINKINEVLESMDDGPESETLEWVRDELIEECCLGEISDLELEIQELEGRIQLAIQEDNEGDEWKL